MNNEFLIDLWSDLRAKRMWPVALLLLLALIAVPLLLSKSSEEPAVVPVATPSKAEQSAEVKGLAALTVADDTTGKGSTLDVFDPSNPFKPPTNILDNSEDDAGTGTGEVPTSDATAATDTGSTGSSDTGSDSGGGTSTGGGSTPSDGGTKTVEYRYVADVTFTGANGKKRKIKGLERLEILPNERTPLLIFLGAGKNGGNAVFLVDSTLTAEGEGKCRPSKAECGFLYLGPGSEEEFVNEAGDAYTLRVDAIRKVKVTPKRATGSKSSAGGGDTTADAAVEGDTAVRRFVPRLLGDLVSESTVQTDSSDGDQTGR